MPGGPAKAISSGHYGKIRANCSGMSASPPLTQISKPSCFLSFYGTLSEFIFPFGSDGLANETSFHPTPISLGLKRKLQEASCYCVSLDQSFCYGLSSKGRGKRMGATELDQAGPFQSAALPPSVPPLQRPLPGWGSLPVHTSSHGGLEQDVGGEKGRRCLEN